MGNNTDEFLEGLRNDIAEQVKKNISNSNKKEKIKLDSIKIEYKKRRKFKNEKYEILIPDDFEITKDGYRDFTASLKYPNDASEDMITIYAGTESKCSELSPDVATESAYLMDFDFRFWGTIALQYKMRGENIDYYKVNLKQMRANVMERNSSEAERGDFIFVFHCDDIFKLIRIEIKNVEATKKEMRDLEMKLMDKFKSVYKLEKVTSLDDKYFIKNEMTPELVDEASELVKNMLFKLRIQFDICQKVLDKYAIYKNFANEFSDEDFEQKIRTYLKMQLSDLEKFLNGSLDIIENAKSKNIPIEKIHNLCLRIYGLIAERGKLEILITDSDERITERAEKALEIADALSDDIANCCKSNTKLIYTTSDIIKMREHINNFHDKNLEKKTREKNLKISEISIKKHWKNKLESLPSVKKELEIKREQDKLKEKRIEEIRKQWEKDCQVIREKKRGDIEKYSKDIPKIFIKNMMIK